MWTEYYQEIVGEHISLKIRIRIGEIDNILIMAGTLKYRKIGDSGYMESEYFHFSKDELIEIFKSHQIIGGKTLEEIENHEFVSVSNRTHSGHKYHFYPKKDSDEYVFFMTKPIGEEPMIYDKLKSLLLRKESRDLNINNDEDPWTKTWPLKP